MTTTPALHRLSNAIALRLQQARDERGALMSEYGILIFFVGIAAFGILVLFGGEVWELFTAAESEFDQRTNDGPPPFD